jgi:hypothetical protein
MGANKMGKEGLGLQGTDMNRWVPMQPRLLSTSFSGFHIVWHTLRASNQESRQSENPSSLNERNQMKARLASLIAIAFLLSACTNSNWFTDSQPSTMMQGATLQANA